MRRHQESRAAAARRFGRDVVAQALGTVLGAVILGLGALIAGYVDWRKFGAVTVSLIGLLLAVILGGMVFVVTFMFASKTLDPERLELEMNWGDYSYQTGPPPKPSPRSRLLTVLAVTVAAIPGVALAGGLLAGTAALAETLWT